MQLIAVHVQKLRYVAEVGEVLKIVVFVLPVGCRGFPGEIQCFFMWNLVKCVVYISVLCVKVKKVDLIMWLFVF